MPRKSAWEVLVLSTNLELDSDPREVKLDGRGERF